MGGCGGLTEKDLQSVREFLDLVRSLVIKGRVLEQEFDGFFVAYDGYWTRYRKASYSVRCQIPEDVSSITDLPECARNCWKLLMFRRKPEDVEASVKLLLPLLKNGEIKSFKHNGDTEELESLKGKAPYVIVIYTWGAKERDELKAKLHSLGFTNIPYRRGCKAFEKRFGHWKQWFKDKK